MSRPGIMDQITSAWSYLYEVNTHHRERCVASPTVSCQLCREEFVAFEQADRTSAAAIEQDLIGPAGRIAVSMHRAKYARRLQKEIESMKEKAR